jgi:hypothetical protein
MTGICVLIHGIVFPFTLVTNTMFYAPVVSNTAFSVAYFRLIIVFLDTRQEDKLF